MPLLGGLRQALCALLSGQDAGHLAIYRRGLAVLSYVEDEELIPVCQHIKCMQCASCPVSMCWRCVWRRICEVYSKGDILRLGCDNQQEEDRYLSSIID